MAEINEMKARIDRLEERLNNKFEESMEWAELSDMRAQIGLLKERLSREIIINDKMVRRAIGERASFLWRRGLLFSIIGLVAIPYLYWAYSLLGVSPAFLIVTLLFMLTASLYTFHSHFQLRPHHLSECDLLTVGQKAAELKRKYVVWHYFSIPFVICWLGWFIWEFYQSNPDLPTIIVSFLVGALIGGWIGWRQHRSVVRAADEILRQVEELSERD